jgi:hypothetical protein
MTEAVETIETIANDGQEPLELWIEPWAVSLIIPPGQQFAISGHSDLPGGFEVDRVGGRVVVYAWAGSTAVVRHGDAVIRIFDIPVPGIPTGMSMKRFVGTVFGETAGETIVPTSKRPWWRPW